MTSTSQPRLVFSGRERRYLLTHVLVAAGRELSVAEIHAEIVRMGFAIHGPVAKRISDGLRVPRERGWVVRTRRGHYRAGSIPKTSLRRIRLMPARMLSSAWPSWE